MKNAIFLSLVMLVVACSNSTSSVIDENRGALGKSDLVGYCNANDCDNGQAEKGNCYCDDLCEQFGDCCYNKVDVCGGEPAQLCGTRGAQACPSDMYCHFEDNTMCGALDQGGECRFLPTPPVFCTKEFHEVCGCDGNTYSNTCMAYASATSVSHDGPCEEVQPEVTFCGGLLGAACAEGQYCHYEPEALCGAADAPGECREIPDACITVVEPVCGCDGNEYSNSCFAAIAGTGIIQNGPCTTDAYSS